MANFEGNGNNNTINGSANDDDIYGKGGQDWLYGNEGVDYIDAGVGDDFLFGGDGDDILFGGKGSDLLQGGLGADQLKGGKGIDTADYSDATSAITVYIENDTALGYAAGDTFENIENLVGTAFADSLQAGYGGKAFGGGGGDTLYGVSFSGSHAGVLRGDAGYDTLRMDFGNTTAWLQNGLGYDTIEQFVENADNFFIDLSDFGFGATLDDSELVNSDTVTAVGGNAQFIYDGDDSRLYFDSNGTGAGGLVLIADIENSTVYNGTLDTGDFEYQV